MPFLQDDDYAAQLRNEVAQIIGATGGTRQQAENMVQSVMEGYISTRYDATATFAATGSNRNPALIMYMIDMVVYLLHSKIATRAIPKERHDRNEAAMEWLKMLAAGKLNPDLPVATSGQADYLVHTGSNPKRSRQW